MSIVRLLCAATAALAVALSSSAAATAGHVRDPQPLINRGFEAGMSKWACQRGSAAVVTHPVYSGSRALAGRAGTRDNAYCTQTMNVMPDFTYLVTAWVRGRYVRMGVLGLPPVWKSGGEDWYPLQLEFRTGRNQRTATFYFAGTKGHPYGADQVSVEVVCPVVDPESTPCPSLFWP